MKTLLPLLLLVAPVFAEDAVPASTSPVEAAEPAAKPEPAMAPVSAPVPASAVASPAAFDKKPAAPKPVSAEDEWAFAKATAKDTDSAAQEVAADELRLFLRRHPDAPQAADALALLAGLRQQKGDWQSAAVALLRAIHEFPESKAVLRAKSSYLELVEKNASRKQRPALNELVAVPAAADKADRLSAVWQRASVKAPDALFEPLAAEIRDFSVRFPEHPEGDKLQAALARLYAANEKPATAMLAWRKILALFPDGALRPAAQLAIGDLYAEALRDPKKAIDAYQELIDKYHQASEVQSALDGSARLFEEKLKQYDLAVEMEERVAKDFPKTAASLKALKTIARLQRELLAKPEEAIKTEQRLSTMHGGQDGVDALLRAAEIARRDLKDYTRQAALLHQIADDYASAKEAPQALYDAAGIYDADLVNAAMAIDTYKEVAAKYPKHKLAKKSAERAVKLEGK